MEVSTMGSHCGAWRVGTIALAAAGLIVLGTTASAADELSQALDVLGQARQELKLSKNDKGGHRARAMKRIDEAVAAIKEEQQHDASTTTKAIPTDTAHDDGTLQKH
jgi:hypothetical protein